MDTLYEPTDAYLIRVPLLPVEHLVDAPPWKPSEFSVTKPHLVRRAVMLASASLHSNLERAGHHDAKLTQALNRYRVRMTARATPFGLFAGVALGHWGPSDSIRIARPIAVTRTRLDGSWWQRFINLLEEDREIRTQLSYHWHPGARLHGSRIVLADAVSHEEHEAGLEAWVSSSRAVVAVAGAARGKGNLYSVLVSFAAGEMPGCTLAQAEHLIDLLWSKGLLVSELRHPIISDPLTHTVRLLSSLEGTDRWVSFLLQIDKATRGVDAVPELVTVAEHQQLLDTLSLPHASKPGDAYLQVDSSASIESPSLPRTVGEEVCEAVSVLLRLSRFPEGLANLQDYRRRFLERYGYGSEVPLMELTDPVRGIGMPRQRNIGRVVERRNELLFQAATVALYQRQLTLEITDQLLEELTTADLSKTKLPRSLDFVATVGARSREDLNAGKFTLVISPGFGGLAGGKHLGRFADLLGEECRNLLDQISHAEQAWDPHKLAVELVFPPQKAEHLNVCARTVSRPYMACYGAPATVGEARHVMLSEVVVGLQHSSFYARWTRENVEIRPCGWHMLNPIYVPPPLQFLVDIAADSQPLLIGFSWGQARYLPRTPRVTRGRLVLCPARWRLTRSSSLGDAAMASADWDAAVAQWREEWQVPPHVFLGIGDQRLFLDLNSATGKSELRRELRGLKPRGALFLSEVLPALEETWLEGPQGHHVCEIAVPVTLRGSGEWRGRPASLNMRVLGGEREMTLGSEWVYVELYAPQPYLDALIAGPLRHFCHDQVVQGFVDYWFFIRYFLEGHHIRLRVHGRPEGLLGGTVPRLNVFLKKLSEGGWISRFEYRTYKREIIRYGGLACMEQAEQIFAADSVSCAALLDAFIRSQVKHDRRAVVAWTIKHLLDSIGIDEGQLKTVLQPEKGLKVDVSEVFRQEKEYLRQAFSGGKPDWMDENLALVFEERRKRIGVCAEEIKRIIRQGKAMRTLESISSSLVHMHCNRVLGVDLQAEQAAKELILRTLRSIKAAPVAIKEP